MKLFVNKISFWPAFALHIYFYVIKYKYSNAFGGAVKSMMQESLCVNIFGAAFIFYEVMS